ncbi:DcaP family trimeric outer membrane transporter [Vreelandella rituensis]|uniref:Porin n=1 Tax=Vreelandella rituensis TaxID=2282306 RepID=A0A368TVN3_9GAMM|nr:DcaP family trimeric outer membrane transporter [Halomonas rituensis]RCV88730.1 hypothetical protein DU506_14195 [Halomonas rituensis]
MTISQRNLLKPTLLALSVVGAGVMSMTSSAVSFEVGETKASVYGFAKLDAIYDRDNDLGNLAARPRILIDGQTGVDGNFDMHAYQSRLGFKTATPAAGSPLVTHVEVDWFDNVPEGGELRLRHAYGSWNNVLAGKTWTNFGSQLSRTPIIDFAPSPGQSKSGRKAQLRYTMGDFHVALENPEPHDFNNAVAVGFNPARGGYAVSQDNHAAMPDATLRYQTQAGDLHYSLSAVAHQLNVEGEKLNDDAMGWGINAAASYPMTPAFIVRGGLTYGDGIGEYMQNNPSAPGFLDGGEIETIEAWGANVGMSLKTGPGVVNLGYGVSNADMDDAVKAGLPGAAGANEKFEAVHLNYIWSPVKRVSYGVEAGYHTRKVADGRDGDALRIQGMAMYAF